MEARHGLGVGGQLGAQDLDRHRLVHERVRAAIDGAHAALPQALDEAIAPAQDPTEQRIVRVVRPQAGAGPEAPPATAPATGNSAAATENAPAATGTALPSGMASPEKRYAMPDGGTLNGDPRGPREAEVKPLLDAALVDVRACFDASPE